MKTAICYVMSTLCVCKEINNSFINSFIWSTQVIAQMFSCLHIVTPRKLCFVLECTLQSTLLVHIIQLQNSTFPIQLTCMHRIISESTDQSDCSFLLPFDFVEDVLFTSCPQWQHVVQVRAKQYTVFLTWKLEHRWSLVKAYMPEFRLDRILFA